MLGRLGDPSTVEPLLDALSEDKTRYLVVLALGKIGDPRAYKPLMNIIENDRQLDVRGYAVVGLGWLGIADAVPRLVRLLLEEPEIKWTSESIVRLGGVGQAPVFGTDATKGAKSLKSGFGRCTEKPRIVHGGFLERTTCRTTGPRAELEFFADAPKGASVIVRARHLLKGKAQNLPLNIRVNGLDIGKVELSGDFQEHRIITPPGTWPSGEHKVTLELSKGGRFEIDHLLVVAFGK
jgi:hypothetical protein